MRGGTSKGVFFNQADLPAAAQQPGPERDAFLQRVIGSPDPYEKQIDGMGGATSSTSKTVIINPSDQPDHDIDYLFGQVAIDRDFVDWSGNCGNLSAAVGPFAIEQGLIDPAKIPHDGVAEIRIWQANIERPLSPTLLFLKVESKRLATLNWTALPSPPLKLHSISYSRSTLSARRCSRLAS
jgi:2-methylaconitate cis-trans-isomerase PrpF